MRTSNKYNRYNRRIISCSSSAECETEIKIETEIVARGSTACFLISVGTFLFVFGDNTCHYLSSRCYFPILTSDRKSLFFLKFFVGPRSILWGH